LTTSAFPSLPGITWPVIRSPIWQTRGQQSVSGKKINIADWSFPMWRWELTYNFLRGYTTALFDAEIATMEGFFNTIQGSFDSFLYRDANDNTAVGSTIGTGDSTNKAFQLKRPLGGYVEPITAPTSISNVYVGSTIISSTQWSLSYWASTAPGIVTFSTFAPTTGQAVTADFQYSWPVSFDDDTISFEEFVKKIWNLKKISMTLLK